MTQPEKILLTGASGFVGQAVLKAIRDFEVISVGRRAPDTPSRFFQAELTDNTDFQPALTGVTVVIHAAARAHIMHDEVVDPLAEYRKVNVAATLNLARQAAAAGVKRFIFISSIKVNGEQTLVGQAFTAQQPPEPQDAYGISKAEAEAGLKQIAGQSGMELIIIRPPLVYGPGVKGNFATLLKIAQKNLPLPLGAIANKRSLVALDNLVDLIVTCITHPKAANQTFLVSDDKDISTTELLKLLTIAAGNKPCLLPVPVSWLQLVAKLTGKQAVVSRLCGDLQLDISHTKTTLGWVPPLSVEDGIKRCFAAKE
ncbi:MAG: SDR family oxidoreductase [Gammaproteobacteria bacterium]|nr:SDR family oxidoreductase [Gammaproteobacteria bacterium]MBU2069661.1 SDR family oxidoreductase [Gammaproteobacteria bacterium]MBU2184526.1 SDR family oxidoreductase [Gammaproteobacteria bacterium]MBU2205208.1 SDR family oxidoreductase [Gammaproteobacteria bacterium]